MSGQPGSRLVRVTLTAATVAVVCVTGADAQAPQPPSHQPSASQTEPAQTTSQLPEVREYIEVTATRLPEPPDEVAAPIEVISGEELESRGVRDLPAALALATGVSITGGGDGGPASSTPEFWGLKELDAFLLVVDGVPWGGAFNPALSTLNVNDIERIEVLRGPAPVTYGATSFVGVIQVVRKSASTAGQAFGVRMGNHRSGGGSVSLKLPFAEGWDSRLAVDADRQGFQDDRTAYRRGHVLWQTSHAWDKGRLWFNVDGTLLGQDPASPHPREGKTLSSQVPLDANHNPDRAFLNERRGAFMFGLERNRTHSIWTTTASFSRANQDIFRGFLLQLSDAPDNARGLRETIDLTDVYADTHVAWTLPRNVRLVTGGDYLHGNGNARGADFDYEAPLDGGLAPAVGAPTNLDVRITDRRDFVGAYTLAEWDLHPKVRVSGGVRLNITNEEREEGDAGPKTAEEEARNRRTDVGPGGNVGIIWRAWTHGADRLHVFADYRNTYKPAAFDFGIGEADGGQEGLLEPETSQVYEMGLKSRLWQGRVSVEVVSFLMDFHNLVLPSIVNGLPGLINAGSQRFKGIENAVAWYLPHHLNGRATYSFHDARFRDFLTEFDGEPTQIAGNRLEMSARHLASVGLIYSPDHGMVALVEGNYVGSRFLNKRNSALANGYATLAAGVGYRLAKWELRIDGRNLTDQRPPVAESELGDAQYYRLIGRTVDLSLGVRF